MISVLRGRRFVASASASLALCVLCLGSTRLEAQKPAPLPRVTRGAYLQMGTATSVVVRWRTAVPTTSVVRYGTVIDNLDRIATGPGRFREHTVPLSGLAPGTVYYYSVGTRGGALQGGRENYFRTAPLPNSMRPVRVWVLGDPGTGFPVQRAVRDAYGRASAGIHTDLILTLGDNAYPDATERQFDVRFFDVYRSELKHSVLWPAFGNHDARNSNSKTASGVYFDLFTLPRGGEAGGAASGTEAWYAFDFGNVHFICLDSQGSDLSEHGRMIPWLRRDLASSARQWTIAYWHHPPYSKGSHDSDSQTGNDRRMLEMREKVVPILETAGVDLVLCGHSHLYERSHPLRGHYGHSNSFQPSMIRGRTGRGTWNGGTVYVNAGSAGHATAPEHLKGLNHPAMAVAINVAGSLYLDIAGPRLRAVFLDASGTERDDFVLEKGKEPTRP